ncbi:hypothetical protein [Epibacterium ulvae]|uniref:hypothetical protein n=1 Tax=Epibacterium ulvae TaxID=1156985 RepID=UPI0024931D36|nr:hypothetical protein [Epibacterium ulvae]
MIARRIGAIGFLTVSLCWAVYSLGYRAALADFQADQLAQIEAGQTLERERHRLQLERDQLAQKLEEQAHADPVVVDQCLSPDRVRRLNAIR